jgi:hypothetical protein
MPSAASVIAASIVFGKAVHDLFPSLYASVETKVGSRALKLFTKVEWRRSAAAAKKREVLQAIATLRSSVCE